MENKQTAVEFMYNEMLLHLNFDQRLYLREIYQQAKEMEKQQIIDAHNEGDLSVVKNAEEYYELTFKT